MAIIKIMQLISLPGPGHICGRRGKRKGIGMERAYGFYPAFPLSRPATQTNKTKRLALFFSQVPSLGVA